MQVKSIYIWSDGDPSVGINGDSCTIKTDGDFIFESDEFNSGNIEEARLLLERAFDILWGDNIHVMFDFENKEPE